MKFLGMLFMIFSWQQVQACSLGNFKPVEVAKTAVTLKHILVRGLTGVVVSGHDFYTNPNDFDGGGTCPDLIYSYVKIDFKKLVSFRLINCVAMVKVLTPVNIPIPKGEREATVLSSACVRPL